MLINSIFQFLVIYLFSLIINVTVRNQFYKSKRNKKKKKCKQNKETHIV